MIHLKLILNKKYKVKPNIFKNILSFQEVVIFFFKSYFITQFAQISIDFFLYIHTMKYSIWIRIWTWKKYWKSFYDLFLHF